MNISEHIEQLIARYPSLKDSSKNISIAYDLLQKTVEKNGTIYCCGNGGSFSDSEHVVGELLKTFKQKRPIDNKNRAKLVNLYGREGEEIGKKLEKGIKAHCLGSQSAFAYAFSNDVDADLIFAQELLALGTSKDILLCLSSSGSSRNIKYAAMIAKVLDIKVILLTGDNKGDIGDYSDCIINVPEKETYKIQELHLPVYHVLCMALEDELIKV